MNSQQQIEKFLASRTDEYDLELVSQPSKFTGRRALYRASIDKAREFGNLAVSGWENSIQEAFDDLWIELQKELNKLGKK